MEEPVQFTCNHKRLYGIVHVPEATGDPTTITIIVTGGPQVRIGAHRLYVQLSRFLCDRNIPTLRFDYEGSGDSEGPFIGFSCAGSSIAAAIDFLQGKFKNKLHFIIWSLCDGATAAALHAAKHPEHIIGLILCNPLIITDEGLARSTIRHYYARRLFDSDFLRKLFSFKLDFMDTVKSLGKYLKDAYPFINPLSNCLDSAENSLPHMVFRSLHDFKKPVRLILSTDDIVASNFHDELKKHDGLKSDFKNKKIISHVIDGADHTFVDPDTKEELFEVTLEAIKEIELSLLS